MQVFSHDWNNNIKPKWVSTNGRLVWAGRSLAHVSSSCFPCICLVKRFDRDRLVNSLSLANCPFNQSNQFVSVCWFQQRPPVSYRCRYLIMTYRNPMTASFPAEIQQCVWSHIPYEYTTYTNANNSLRAFPLIGFGVTDFIYYLKSLFLHINQCIVNLFFAWQL